MENIPLYVSLTFIACVMTVFGFLFYAISQASPGRTTMIVTSILSLWILFVSTVSLRGFLEDFDAFPPRLILLVFPLVIIIVGIFFIPKCRQTIAKMPITSLTYIHIIRVPVEIMLWWLFLLSLVPITMTFEGGNYDIISGITAPFAGVFLLGSTKGKRIGAIVWNLMALGLLITIVSRAILATPYFLTPADGLAPNIAVFYFPFVLLPTFVVPVIFFCHLASLYKLIIGWDRVEL